MVDIMVFPAATDMGGQAVEDVINEIPLRKSLTTNRTI
jgi:hypothetical protein